MKDVMIRIAGAVLELVVAAISMVIVLLSPSHVAAHA